MCEFFQGSEGSKSHIWLPNSRLLHRDEPPEWLTLKASGVCIHQSQRAVEKRFYCERMHAKSHMLQDPWQSQQSERSLGHTHLLILERLLEKQKAVKTPPGDIDAGRSHFRDLVCQEDTRTGRYHLECSHYSNSALPTRSPAPDLGLSLLKLHRDLTSRW